MTSHSETMLPGDLSARAFLEQHWGRAPLFVPKAFEHVSDLVDPNELAGAACEPDIESRLVLGSDALNDWSSESGPFDEARFDSLGPEGWTLLVQSVETWSEEVARLLDAFRALPAWALDDVMVSYATEGGGVGPHFDYYDVFLVQVQGERLWRTGQMCNATTALRDNANLKLLADFEERQSFHTKPGDMLYVPAGTAHWGTSLSADCITCSIGFRAPSYRELYERAVDEIFGALSEDLRVDASAASLDNDVFEIPSLAVQHLVKHWREVDEVTLTQAITRALGGLATETRREVDESDIGHDGWEELEPRYAPQPGTRMAYAALKENSFAANLFVNGQTFETPLSIAKAICNAQISQAMASDPQYLQLMQELVERGWFYAR